MIRRFILTLAVATALSCWAAGAPAADERTTGTQHAGAGETESHAGAAHGAEGHKTYELLPNPSDPQTLYAALWVLIIFIILLAILYPTAWKNVLAGLKAREERIRKDIAEAAAGRVRDMLAKATADGEMIAAGIRTRAQRDAEETKERALRDIDAARDQAV